LLDIGTRTAVQADTRKPWKDIFFDENPDKPMTEASAGSFKIPLAALRLAPSASNKQPWRIIRSDGKLHLFLERTPNYWQEPREDIQMLDMGIAMCNFDAAAEEEGNKGKWAVETAVKGREEWIYIATRVFT
jgi:hypothetical protein